MLYVYSASTERSCSLSCSDEVLQLKKSLDDRDSELADKNKLLKAFTDQIDELQGQVFPSFPLIWSSRITI